jgi:zinc transporter 7
LAIFVGFAAFFIMEKSLRVLGGGEGHAHSHDPNDAVPEKGSSSAVEPNDTSDSLRSRRKVHGEQQPDGHDLHDEKNHVSGPSKLSAYLNLFGDFVHNM